MKPVMQTRTGTTDGNCLEACIASLLEVPIEGFPRINDTDNWVEELNATLAPLGFYYMCFEQNPTIQFPVLGYHVIHDGKHAVVAHRGELVHDPHPLKPGVSGKTTYGILVPLNPALSDSTPTEPKE